MPKPWCASRQTGKLKKAAFAHQVPLAEWSGRFEVPIDTKPSEGFGTRRTFNGQLASIHKGMDYHAAPGTPVLSANAGEVVLAAPLFYEGNCVIINHGQQFLTIYMHLSKLSVKEGDKVEKGQEVGLSGATGRATGPHLHVAVAGREPTWIPRNYGPCQLPALAPDKGHRKQQQVAARVSVFRSSKELIRLVYRRRDVRLSRCATGAFFAAFWASIFWS